MTEDISTPKPPQRTPHHMARKVMLATSLLVAGHNATAMAAGNDQMPPPPPGLEMPDMSEFMQPVYVQTPESVKEQLKETAGFATGLDATATFLHGRDGKNVGVLLPQTPALQDKKNVYTIDGEQTLLLRDPVTIVNRRGDMSGLVDRILKSDKQGGAVIGVLKPLERETTPDDMVQSYNALDDQLMKPSEAAKLKPGQAIHIEAITRSRPTMDQTGKLVPPAGPYMGDFASPILLGSEVETHKDGSTETIMWAALPPTANKLDAEDYIGAPGITSMTKPIGLHSKQTTSRKVLGTVSRAISFVGNKMGGPSIDQAKFSQQFHVNLSKSRGVVGISLGRPSHESVSAHSPEQFKLMTQGEAYNNIDWRMNFGAEVYEAKARKEFMNPGAPRMLIIGGGYAIGALGSSMDSGPPFGGSNGMGDGNSYGGMDEIFDDPGDGEPGMGGDPEEPGEGGPWAGGPATDEGPIEDGPPDWGTMPELPLGMPEADGMYVYYDQEHGNLVIGYTDLSSPDGLRTVSLGQVSPDQMLFSVDQTGPFEPGALYAAGRITISEDAYCFQDEAGISFGGLTFVESDMDNPPKRFGVYFNPESKDPTKPPLKFVPLAGGPGGFDMGVPTVPSPPGGFDMDQPPDIIIPPPEGPGIS